MSTAFSRTLQALRADRFGSPLLALLLVAILLSAWLGWFFLAPIARYEVSGTARLEVDQEAHTVQSPLLGRVVASRLVLGRQVEAGEVLVELDSNPEQLQIREAEATLKGLDAQMVSLEAQALAAEDARARERQGLRHALDEASARLHEADALARLADGEAARLEKLRVQGLIPQREFEQGRLEAERRRAAADSLRPVNERLEREQFTREGDREVTLKGLRAGIRKLEADAVTLRAGIVRLRYEIERRLIRAPIAGRLGEVARLRPGAVVDEGEKLGAIVPAGRLRAIAEFPPAAALGRIRPGQRARLRLEGFPWTQYGSIAAAVSGVAGEIRDGSVRVELSVEPEGVSRVPMQHGLPGSVEVEVERVSPAELVLRAAGRLLATPREHRP